MPTKLSPRVTEYFSRNDAAADWWNIDNSTGGRYKKQIDFIKANVKLQGLKTLDVATGRGRFAIEFATSGASEVIAVDIAASMIEIAKENAKQLGVADKIGFRVGNAAELDLVEEHYDIISLMEVLVHLPDPAGVVSTLLRYLKPGGVFITNYDFPYAPKITYPIDALIAFTRGVIGRRFKKDVVMYDTVDETIQKLEHEPEKKAQRVMRPKDAYRGIARSEVDAILHSSNLVVTHRLPEYISVFGIPLPIKIGEMIIAKKKP